MQATDPLKTVSEACRDGISQLTRLTLEGQQKMLGLNIDAMQEFIQQSGQQLEQNWSDLGHIDPMTAWPAFVARNVKCGMAINMLFCNLGARLYKDMGTTSRTQMQALNSELKHEVGRYTAANRQLAAALSKAEESTRKAA